MLVKHIVQRPISDAEKTHEPLHQHPVLDRIYRSRGVKERNDLDRDLAGLIPFQRLSMIEKAAQRLHEALVKQESIVIVGDFDADGATSTAIAVRGLRLLGAKQVNFLVPNRFKYGYGLTPEIVELAHAGGAEVIITVDNGISSLSGVDRAHELNMTVIITDHHLAGHELPKADAIVNPNQPGDEFPSKALAGCGVIFYVLLALRAHLRLVGWFIEQGIAEPNMAVLLDLVALGTVADVVPLDRNNRILVHQGLKRIRAGFCIPGIRAMLALGKREPHKMVASDLGFAVAPRLNAAGRLDDMSLGIACLLTDDEYEATRLAAKLDLLNQERKQIESSMKQQAFKDLAKLNMGKSSQMPMALCLYDEHWHQGVIGILAARLKDHWHRPVVVFAPGDNGEIKGSGRSINGVHLRDILQQVDAKHPGLILRFGGHAMAAGLTVLRQDFTLFREAFLREMDLAVHPETLKNQVVSDGALEKEFMALSFAELLREEGPWGQHFPEPLFHNQFKLIDQRLVGECHLKLVLGLGDELFDAICFNVDREVWPNYRCQYVEAAYRLDVNEFRGKKKLQLMVDYMESRS